MRGGVLGLIHLFSYTKILNWLELPNNFIKDFGETKEKKVPEFINSV